jgi:hypothetical protein
MLLVLSVIAATGATAPDIRLARGLGSRGYGTVRLSVISAANGTGGGARAPFFTYDQPFRWRWTDKRVQSGLLNAKDGEQTVDLGDGAGGVVQFSLPAEGAGVTGVLLGDPCTESDFVGCIHFNGSSMGTRLPRLANALADVDFRALLGDNFYDQTGEISSRFFAQLTPQARAQWQVTVPGNHDFWRTGVEAAKAKADSFGNGFLQFYAQDTAAAQISDTPFNLSVSPDGSGLSFGALPDVRNFFLFHKLGNLGFIGYSGAHSQSQHEPLFAEACASFLASPRPDVIFLLGHWSVEGLGCAPGMSTPKVFERLQKLVRRPPTHSLLCRA